MTTTEFHHQTQQSRMSTLISTLDYPFEVFTMCSLRASQHLPTLLRVTMIVIIVAAGYYLKQWLQHCVDGINRLLNELSRYKATCQQQNEIIQHLAAENIKMRSKEAKVEAYMQESAHTLLVIFLRGRSEKSSEEGSVPAGTVPKGDSLLPQDPEDVQVYCLPR